MHHGNFKKFGYFLTLSINMKKRILRKDVALAAGVSTTTVTYALTDSHVMRISKDTRERVKRIAKELGYRPNFTGRVLVDGKTYNIGILQPAPGSIKAGFYQQMIFGAAEAMQDTEYHLSLFFPNNPNCFDMLRQGRVDGMFVIDSGHDNKNIEILVSMNIPTVILNRTVPETCRGSAVSVRSGNRQMIRDVMDDFHKSGCKNILAINNYTGAFANYEIFQEFSQCLSSLASEGIIGITVDPHRILPSEQATVQFNKVLTSGRKWDAVYIDGIDLADCFCSEAEKCGLKAGIDYKLAVSCINENIDDLFKYNIKDMSYFSQQPEIVGKVAWETMNKLWNESLNETDILIPYKKGLKSDN